MKGKLSLGQYLIWLILILWQLHICKSCIEKERKALLELKNYMISRTDDQSLIADVIPTWTNDTKSDCCMWEGVECNRTNRRIIRLSVVTSMFSNESFLLDLSLLHPFEEIRSVNLSNQYTFNGFFDDVEGYKSLGRLRNLEILDLSSNVFNQSIFPFLNAATSLRTLFLQYNYMNGPFPFKELKDLTNLELLDLSENFFNGSMQELGHLKQLKFLDLSSNYFPSSMELQELKNLTNLEVFGVAKSNLDGPIPKEVFCEMKNIQELNLRGNHFVGQLPHCFGSLKKLRVLDLSSNQLSGNLPFSFNSLESLEYLSLSDNNFMSLFSISPLTNLTKLKVLKLSSLSNMVQVKTNSTWLPKFQLSVVELRSCSLETIPSFLVNQKNLRLVDLSSNELSGNIPTWLLDNNLKLEVLQLQNNSFTIFEMHTRVHNLRVLDFSANNIHGLFPNNIGHAFPNLVRMNGSNNGFNGHFPSSISEMKNITFLDLSYNNFSGELPKSFITGCISLTHLELSHNKFSGYFLPSGTSFTSLILLRMDNNLLTGEIGIGLHSSETLFTLDLSNNRLTGTIPSWVFKFYYLYDLLLANNLFEGTIPSSLLGLPFLSVLNLSGNQLSGPLPLHVTGVWGTYMALHDNNFTGEIPNTLLEKVKILDLRNNKLSGSIPQFVNTQDIAILLLRGNNLTGSIPRQLCDLRNIRLLDLSHNKLTGFIPSCMLNMSFGLGEEDLNSIWIPPATYFPSLELEFYKPTFLVDKQEAVYTRYFEIDIRFATKKRYDSYGWRTKSSKEILYHMYGMDLSNNKLSGDIPTELGHLSKLRALNLSHNFLSSSIPSSFSNLTDIESLDLSYNKLHGSIPQQLTSLTSLVVFDVSYNNLSGIIPQGRQFNTFSETYYLGNPLLCGPPSNIRCEDKKRSDEEDHRGKDETSEAPIDMWVFYVSTASTYVIALASILVILSIDCPLRRVWLSIVDSFIIFAKSMLP